MHTGDAKGPSRLHARGPAAKGAGVGREAAPAPRQRHRRRVILWTAIVVILSLGGARVEHSVQQSGLIIGGTESQREASLSDANFGHRVPIVIDLHGPRAAVDAQGPRLVAALERLRGKVLSPWNATGDRHVTRPTAHDAVVLADFNRRETEIMDGLVPSVRRAVDATVHAPVTPHLTGLAIIGRSLRDESLDSTKKAELLTFPILIAVLLLVFRSPIAAALPLIMGGATVAAGRGLLAIAAHLFPVDAVALSLSSMMGLALGVDYALLMVSRYREELAAGADPETATGLARASAGRTIAFAGAVLMAG